VNISAALEGRTVPWRVGDAANGASAAFGHCGVGDGPSGRQRLHEAVHRPARHTSSAGALLALMYITNGRFVK